MFRNNKTNETVKSPKCAKVPVIVQMEAVECGAASLAMILAYYGKWIPLEKVRVDCGVSRDGSSALNLLKAAQKYGLKAEGFSCEVDELKEVASFPCIIHWNFNHFVVLRGFKRDKALLNDPEMGDVSVSMDEFDKSFTGVCLLFSKGDEFVPSGQRKSVINFSRNKLKDLKKPILYVCLITLIYSLISIITPGFTRVFLDRLLNHQNEDWIVPFFILLSVVTIVELVVQSLQVIYTIKVGGKIGITGSSSFMWKILRMPIEFFSQRHAGDILSRKNSNADVSQTLISVVAPLGLNIISVVIYLIMMFNYSVLLSFIGILSIAINIILSKIIAKKSINIARIQMKENSALSSETIHAIQLIETIKASGAEDNFFRRWAGYQAKLNRQEMKALKLNQYLGRLPEFITSLLQCVNLMLGVILIVNGEFTVGMLSAFQSYLIGFSSPALQLVSSGRQIQEMRTSMERIDDIMDYPSEEHFYIDGLSEYNKLSGNIEINNVTFGYSKLSDPLIKDFSLTINAGEKVAIVGATGCGKSTISKLVSGLYPYWSGSILFDGKEISEIDRDIFTGSVAVVEQNITLFEGTIEENIKMWDNTISDTEMMYAATQAQVHNEIMAFPNGYYHYLMENGKNLSGGQAQRVEIARALAQKPSILILDEATSALDANTEARAVKAISNEKITCIIVAHRLSTIRNCDKIIVLDNGHIVEQGTHDELFAKGGFYAELVTNE